MIYPAYVTSKGLSDLKQELEDLILARRPAIAGRIHTAKQIGGTVDNAEYEESKNEQAFIEGRIRKLENLIGSAVIISHDSGRPEIVTIGSKVTVRNAKEARETYIIVGKPEANPANGKISNESPIGQALLGKKVGDTAEIKVPAGFIKLQVSKIY